MPDSTRQQLASNRKQNVACDACRAKKIRCGRESIADICVQCSTKGTECTSHFVESLQNKPVKRPRKTTENGAGPSRVSYDGNGWPQEHGPSNGVSNDMSRHASGSQPRQTHRQAQHELLRFLFSPYAVRHQNFDYSDLADIDLCASGQSDIWESMHGAVYDESPSEAQLGTPESSLNELAEDLLETFLSIVHIRFPILDPEDIRNRFASPDTHPAGPISHPLLAVALAFGARFSDNPAIAADREEISTREQGIRTRSRLVQLLVLRAREVCEMRKIHRIVTEENCATLILLEPLLGQSTFLKEKYQAYHAAAAGRHAACLGMMTRENLLGIRDEKARMLSVYMWWITGLSDGWRSVFNKLKPLFNDHDFDVEPPSFINAAKSSHHGQGNGSAEVDDVESSTFLWFTAGAAGAYICRQLCYGLWTPRVRRSGIATSTLRDFVHANSQWRDRYIAKLGVPSKWPDQWDFLAAISSCSTDAYYHCLWMIVHQAIEEYGLEDEKNDRGGGNHVELDSLTRRISEESGQSALRVASLISVLTENGYLRLDPLILSHPAYIAGLILARAGRPECKPCIAGLRQYSIAFGHLWEAAEEVEQLYRTATGTSASNSVGATPHMPSYPPAVHGSGGMSVDALISDPTASIGYEQGPLDWRNQAQGQEQGRDDGEWNVPGAGAHLAASGFTSLPMVARDGLPNAPTRDATVALFDWIHRPT